MVIVAGDRLLRVDIAALGCAAPGRPVVFRDKVYVPCLGAAKVIVLDRAGKRAARTCARRATATPRSCSTTAGCSSARPAPSGACSWTRTARPEPVTIRSPELPVVNPDRPPIPEVPDAAAAQPPAGHAEPDRDGRQPASRRRAKALGDGRPSTPAGTDGAPDAPPGVTVMLGSRSAAELSVTVSWTAAGGQRREGHRLHGRGDRELRRRQPHGADHRAPARSCRSRVVAARSARRAARRRGHGAEPGGGERRRHRPWTVPAAPSEPTTNNPPPPTTRRTRRHHHDQQPAAATRRRPPPPPPPPRRCRPRARP